MRGNSHVRFGRRAEETDWPRGRHRASARPDHTAATLAAASGTSLKALMARIGHASAAAALRYQHVIDGQDADIVRYLERFGEEPPVPSRAHDDAPDTGVRGHVVGTPSGPAEVTAEEEPRDQAVRGGDDRTRTGDPLLAKQVLFQLSYVPAG
jgi:hypothetical protein